MITLVFLGGATGQVAFPTRRYDGVEHAPRTYTIADSMVTLDSGNADLDAMDAADLLAGGAYRMATPDEQAKLMKKRKKSASINEAADTTTGG